MLRYLGVFLFLVFTNTLLSQNLTVYGKVSANGKVIENAKVNFGNGKGAYTTATGTFEVNGLNSGEYTIQVSAFGYENFTARIQLLKDTTQLSPFNLTPIKDIEGVTVSAETDTKITQQEAYNVTAIDLKPVQNLNLNVNEVLNGTPGIRVRESGGTGSDFSFSLNGFTGKQVRFFIDGLPTDYLGQAFGLNIVPVNLLDRIEVYKGVVPVRLGADVLGGAVNIVTKNKSKDFVDASYSLGSFNTHKAALVARHTTKNNFILNASGFYTSSENNYFMDAFLANPLTGAIDKEPTRIQRFNDAFRSSTGLLEMGVVNKKYADRLLIGFIASQTYKEIQQGANMTKVAGHVFTQERTFIPTLKYAKEDLWLKGLDLKVSAIYSDRQAITVDTSSRIYDWTGNYTEKDFSATSGELNWYKSYFTFNDKASLVTSTVDYALNKKHSFTFNNTFSWFQRQGEDTLSYSEVPFSNPNILQKNFMGLSYNLNLLDGKWESTAFVKSFQLRSVLYLDPESEYEDFIRSEAKQNYTGYGAASTYHIRKNLQVKASYENAYRLPEGYEIFGDGLLLRRNYELLAEQSQNFNLSLGGSKQVKTHKFQGEVGFIYRLPQNMIRRVAVGIASQYQNLLSAQVTGLEIAFKYTYKKRLHLELNSTYQNMLNTNQYSAGFDDPLYLDRIPNIPYFFGNGSITFNSKEFGKKGNHVSLRWHSLFVEEFYLKWPSQGATEFKNIIPRQIAHNLSITFNGGKGKYNLSLACNNLFDSKLYDNFKIQKPGRNFNLKLRYYITKK
ncbi:Outer membrane receptor proteins, mostly Fe transport [Lishizhenia tianjinensis]|uniref:Outer membrane receptor proteins, mostly Fe transport n=1 Tax=Lishizhenia tianjinensis TaxID=477690 RepID=A0A1I6Y9C8_9FLAO|nr:TonB-dependent receptor plug domain-containing protein [Lishizhenia tianjinensis]SFT46774.1 Outer membrane receptor proteins, mostly Fe transport [Lishizhenia tianjinensis]